jgi:hypothetical protein
LVLVCCASLSFSKYPRPAIPPKTCEKFELQLKCSPSAELFWVRQYTTRTQLPGFFRGSFASSGVWVYQEHLAMVRGLGLPRERLLEWTAADGWGPLCEFLGKDVPLEAFPQGNPTTEWVERTGAMMRESNRRAVRNMMIFGTVVIAVVSCIAYVVGFRA